MGFLDYLVGKVNLKQLREWYAPLSMDAMSAGDPDAIRIANAIIGDLSDLDEGFLSEDQFRKNLACLLYPSTPLPSVQQIPLGMAPIPVCTGTSMVIEGRSFAASVGVGPALEYAS